MFKNLTKFTIAAAAVVALPGMAQAGTATASGTAALTTVDQCSVTGTNVNLGTFTTNDTWGTVLAQNGGWNSAGTYSVGSRGTGYANFGSVTCANGTPYTLTIWGSYSSNKLIRLVVAGKTVVMAPFIKGIGFIAIADSGQAPGAGAGVYSNLSVSGTGSGTAQALVGSAQVDLSNSAGTLATDRLATAGTYTDTLTYTLNF